MDTLPKYKSWPEVPGNLKTKTFLKKEGLKPGETKAQVYQRLDKKWIDLYDINEAIPRKKPTEAQLRAVTKAREANIKKRTCTKCGSVFSSPKELTNGLCCLCETDIWIENVKVEAKETFKSWWDNKDNFLILDTETTGLDEESEIVEIAILDLHGRTLLDTLIKPTQPIPDHVINIHGITNEMVINAPTFAEIYEEFIGIVQDKTILIYNSVFDYRLIWQTCKIHGIQLNRIKNECVMMAYSSYFGDYNYGYGSFTWQKLAHAAWHENINVVQNHRALSDCQLVLELIKSIATK